MRRDLLLPLMITIMNLMACSPQPQQDNAETGIPNASKETPERLQVSPDLELDWVIERTESDQSTERRVEGYRIFITNKNEQQISQGQIDFLAFNEKTKVFREVETINLKDNPISGESSRTILVSPQQDLAEDERLLAKIASSSHTPESTRTTIPHDSVVQIALYGLLVFKDTGSEISVYVPRNLEKEENEKGEVKAELHKLSIAVSEETDEGAEWKTIKTHDELTGKLIKFNLRNAESKELTRDKTDITPPFPTSVPQARLPGWLLKESDVEGKDLTPDFDEAITRIVFDDGKFETCGLSYYPTWDNICPVQFGAATRATAEIMVFRVENPDKVNIQICEMDGSACDSIDIKTPLRKDCPKKSIDPSTTIQYSYCYDIAIRNITPRSDRLVTTPHTPILASLFPSATHGQWLQAKALENFCTNSRISPCLERYIGFSGDTSTYERPICPFVEDG